MNTGNSVDLGARCAVTSDDTTLPAEPDAAATVAAPSAEPRVPRSVQDIQEIIDKLAAVTRQLREPGHS